MGEYLEVNDKLACCLLCGVLHQVKLLDAPVAADTSAQYLYAVVHLTLRSRETHAA